MLITAWVISFFPIAVNVATGIAGTLQRGDPAAIMRSHYRAAAAKFILTLLLFGGVLLFFKDLSVPGLFGGFIAATSAYWFGLLIKN